MIQEVKMYSANCDQCGETHETFEGYTALNDITRVKESLEESEWCITLDGKTFCSGCHFTEWNKEGDALYAYSLPSSNAQLLGQIS